MRGTPTLMGPRLRLRQLEAGDAEVLAEIRAQSSVWRWWGEPQPGDFEPPGEQGDLLVIEVRGSVAGAIQYDEVTDPRYRSAGIDLFLGSAWQGRGLGREAIGVLVRHLFEVRGHHRLTIDPAARNERAIRCYEAAGFARVGVMRQYERDTDGVRRDGLLMELLADDWRAR
jgi:aminoglycoside 6'-N-acetyltransferase